MYIIMFTHVFRLFGEATGSPILFAHLTELTQEKTFIGFIFDMDWGPILGELNILIIINYLLINHLGFGLFL